MAQHRHKLDPLEWAELKKGGPVCPGCQHSDFCSVATLLDTGTPELIFACKRDTQPTDKNGTFPYGVWLESGKLNGTVLDYRLARVKEMPEDWTPPPAKPKAPEAPCAPVETLDVVYRWLLAASPATGDERAVKELHGRNLKPEGYGVIPEETHKRRSLCVRAIKEHGEDVLVTVPGFYVDGAMLRLGGNPGILVPCRDPEGRVVALKIRHHNTEEGELRYTTLSSTKHKGPGPGSRAHVPSFRPASRGLRITEGELKADAATVSSGLLTISSPGASAWREAVDYARKIAPRGTEVRIAFDADSQKNKFVAAGIRDIAVTLRHSGIRVAIETWPASAGKGIDDVLTSRNAEQITIHRGVAAWNWIVETCRSCGIDAPEVAPDDDSGEPVRTVVGVGMYRVGAEGAVWLLDENGLEKQSVCNFVPHVAVEYEIRDVDHVRNGGVVDRQYEVDINHSGGSVTRISMTSDQFRGFDPSWLKNLPARLGPADGRKQTRDHLCGAVRVLGVTAKTHLRTQYVHTGWVNHKGRWLFVAPGVTIGSSGATDAVALADNSTTRTVIKTLDMAPRAIGGPADVWAILEAVSPATAAAALGWTFRSLFDRQPAPLWISGQQQSGKTLLATYLLGFVGHRADGDTGAISSESSQVAAMEYLHHRRHLPTFIDDVWKAGQQSRPDRPTVVDQVLRAQYDGGAAAKGARTGGLREDPRLARGSLIVTAETPPPNDGPGGASLRSRTLVVTMVAGESIYLDAGRTPTALLELHRRLRISGKLAAAGAEFVRWMAPQRQKLLDDVKGWKSGWSETHRKIVGDARSDMALADAAWGLELLTRWSEDCMVPVPESISPAFLEFSRVAGEDSASDQADVNPARVFMGILASALTAGVFRIRHRSGGEMTNEDHQALAIGRCDDKTGITHGYVAREDGAITIAFPMAIGWTTIETRLREHVAHSRRQLPATGQHMQRILREAKFLLAEGPKRFDIKRTVCGESVRVTLLRMPTQETES